MNVIATDIGGANARFGIAETNMEPLTGIKNLTCAHFPKVEGAIDSYLKTFSHTPSPKIDATSTVVTTPVISDNIDVTNSHRQLNKTALLEYLPIANLLVINDFKAQSLAQTDPKAIGNKLILKKHTPRQCSLAGDWSRDRTGCCHLSPDP